MGEVDGSFSISKKLVSEYFIFFFLCGLKRVLLGYYRVNYDDTLWSEIETALKSEDFGGIHVLNRAQIIDDVLNLARAGVVSYTRALDVASYLANENEYYPWYSALTAMTYLKRRIGNDDVLKDLFEVQMIMALLQHCKREILLDIYIGHSNRCARCCIFR